MALVIYYTKDCPLPSKKLHTNIPITLDESQEIRNYAKYVEKVVADGHELDFLTQRFKNLPHANAYTTWSGEFARFIAENFPYT